MKHILWLSLLCSSYAISSDSSTPQPSPLDPKILFLLGNIIETESSSEQEYSSNYTEIFSPLSSEELTRTTQQKIKRLSYQALEAQKSIELEQEKHTIINVLQKRVTLNFISGKQKQCITLLEKQSITFIGALYNIQSSVGDHFDFKLPSGYNLIVGAFMYASLTK